MKNIMTVIIILLFGGCSGRQPNDPKPPTSSIDSLKNYLTGDSFHSWNVFGDTDLVKLQNDRIDYFTKINTYKFSKNAPYERFFFSPKLDLWSHHSTMEDEFPWKILSDRFLSSYSYVYNLKIINNDSFVVIDQCNQDTVFFSKVRTQAIIVDYIPDHYPQHIKDSLIDLLVHQNQKIQRIDLKSKGNPINIRLSEMIRENRRYSSKVHYDIFGVEDHKKEFDTMDCSFEKY